MPKRVCDASICEIDRFLRLTNNVVEVVSFIVPRKTQATHFQSDIFPPAPSGEPGLTAARWLSGASAALPTISMKPAHLTEDATSPAPSPLVSPTAGSAPPTASLSPTLSAVPAPFGNVPVHAGPMLLEVKGWFYTAYEPKYFSISANQTLYCFANKESAEAIFALPLNAITELKIDPNHGTNFLCTPLLFLNCLISASRFIIYNNVLPNSFHNVEAYNQADRDKWMRALSNNKPTPASTVAAQEVGYLKKGMHLN